MAAKKSAKPATKATKASAKKVAPKVETKTAVVEPVDLEALTAAVASARRTLEVAHSYNDADERQRRIEMAEQALAEAQAALTKATGG